MKHFLIAVALTIACVSCTRNATVQVAARPDQIVETFVRMSSDVKELGDRKKLAALCQGRIKKALDSISDDAFVINYVNQPISIKRFQVIDTTVDGNLARVHYQIEIDNPNGTNPTEEINEREVEMLKVDGQWYLEGIRHKGSDQIAFTRGMIF